MKSDIHPKYYANAKVTCACGEDFEAGSTMPEINVEICSACHPFFTGEMRYVDTQGRVERFEAMRKKAQNLGKTVKKQTSVQDDQDDQTDNQPKSLKEMMEVVKKAQKN